MKKISLLIMFLGIIILFYPAFGQNVHHDNEQTSSDDVKSQSPEPWISGEDIYSVIEFGAKGDGKTDDTEAIQKAIDKAAERGGKVYLPPRRYLVSGSLNVKIGVSVIGSHEAPVAIEPLIGTIIMATGGKDGENSPALFEMGSSSVVKGLTIFYPEQKVTDIHPYPWTFHLQGMDNTIENITMINSYKGIIVGPEWNVRHRIRSVVGCVLRYGLYVDHTTDIGRVDNVHFHYHWWSAKSIGGDRDLVMRYMYDNLEAFVFGKTDWEYVTNTFVFPTNIGYRFIRTDTTRYGACNGHFTGIGADACQTALLVEYLQPYGLLITGGEFTAWYYGDKPVDPVELVVSEDCPASVRLVNCGFWGPVRHNAILKGPKSYVSFSDCYFTNGYAKPNLKDPDSYLIVAEKGKLQINNCTFDAIQPSIHLKPELKHAIIRGNNGRYGVTIKNEMGDRAIITDNEPPENRESQMK